MKPLAWLEARLDLGAVKRAVLSREVPDRLTWGHALGSATLAAFLVQVVTGIVLAAYYVPAPDHAYDSIRYIERQIAGGALLRGMHHWGASAVTILIIAHMVRVFAMGAYKYPREANWALGVALLVVVLGFAFTGYLLPWDQRAYWATVVGTSIPRALPVVGEPLQTLLRGGTDVGAATLTRFFALHVLVLPASLGLLVLLHIVMALRQGLAPRPAVLDAGAPASTADPGYPEFYRSTAELNKDAAVRLWPELIARCAVVSLLVVLAIAILGAASGAGLEPPADPTDTTYVPMPEWYFLPLYQLMKVVPGWMESVVAVGLPAAVVLVLLALPFFDRRSTRTLRHRPLALTGLAVLFGGSGLLIGAAVREAGPAMGSEGGAILTSVQRAGRALFYSQTCDRCHRIGNEGGALGPDLTAVGLRHSVAWMHSFIEEPSRFHAQTLMPAFAPPRLSHQEIEEIVQYLATLRGGAGPDVQPQFRDSFPWRPGP
ncbi:MAG TPA: cytochrome b N-terminal domain-containing protein [Gemmatimonadales bacterium]